MPFRIGHLYTILRNHVYRGQIKHRGEVHAGEHEPIIDQVLWDKAQAQLASNVAIRRSGKSSKDPSLLAGLLFDGEGNHRLIERRGAIAVRDILGGLHHQYCRI